MKTIVVIEITHEKHIPDLANKVATRAYTLDGVRDTTGWVHNEAIADLQRAGFSLAEISLGASEVER